jgi:hypothetical protein
VAYAGRETQRHAINATVTLYLLSYGNRQLDTLTLTEGDTGSPDAVRTAGCASFSVPGGAYAL